MPESKEAKGFTPCELAGQIDLAATRFLRAFALAGGSMQDLQGWVEHPLMLAHALESSKNWAAELVRKSLIHSMGDAGLKVEVVSERDVPEEIRPCLLHLQERDFLTRNHTSDLVRVSIVTCQDHTHEDPCLLIYMRISERLVGHEGSHHTELRCRYANRAYHGMRATILGGGQDQPLNEAMKRWAEEIHYHLDRDYCHH